MSCSYLINASRGSVVDLEALADALREGHVAGAAVDVYPTEPEKNSNGFCTGWHNVNLCSWKSLDLPGIKYQTCPAGCSMHTDLSVHLHLSIAAQCHQFSAILIQHDKQILVCCCIPAVEKLNETYACMCAELQGLRNVILTPHIGGSTEEAQAAIGQEVATALIKFVNQGSTAGAVNFPQVHIIIAYVPSPESNQYRL